MGKKLEGEWVFLNLEKGEYYGLNETGSVIWDEIKAGQDPEAILERLEKIFPIERIKLEKDLKAFLEELKEEGLIEIANAPA